MTTTSTAAWRNLQSKEPGGRREGSGASHGPLDGRWSRPSARAVPTGVVVVYLPCRKDARFSGPRSRRRSRRLPACLLVTWLRPSSPGSGVRRAGFCRASLSKLQWGWGGVLARPLKAVLRMGESRRFQKLGPLEHRLQAKAAGDSGLSRGLTRAGVGPRPGHLKPLGHLPFSQGPVLPAPGPPASSLRGFLAPSHAAWDQLPLPGRFTLWSWSPPGAGRKPWAAALPEEMVAFCAVSCGRGWGHVARCSEKGRRGGAGRAAPSCRRGTEAQEVTGLPRPWGGPTWLLTWPAHCPQAMWTTHFPGFLPLGASFLSLFLDKRLFLLGRLVASLSFILQHRLRIRIIIRVRARICCALAV